MILIDGKKEAANLREDLKKEVSHLKTKYNKVPGLTVILIGDLAPSQIYVRNKERSAKEVGLLLVLYTCICLCLDMDCCVNFVVSSRSFPCKYLSL